MKFDRLDRAALSAMAVIAAVICVILLRGDQVGVQITRSTPAAGAESVAVRAPLSFTFSEPMVAASLDGRVHLTPAMTGTLAWNGSTAFLMPAGALRPDTAYTLTVQAGAHSERGRMLLRDATWSFRTGHARVVYLSPALELGDLYVAEPGDAATQGGAPSAAPRRITSEPYGVFDFAISPDGTRIVYSANRDDTGTRGLWLINLDGSRREQLVACDGQVCQSPSWAADSMRIAFERRTLVQGAVGRSPGPARIWLIDAGTKQAAPLFNDTGDGAGDGAGQKLGSLPRWAPVGDTLAYYDPLESAVVVVETQSGGTIQLPSVLGDSGTWSPDGRELIYPELEAVDAGQFNQMLRANLASGVITPVMELTSTNDVSIIWSPSGERIAFSRQQIRMGASGFQSFGPQIWVSRPDGTQARPVTAQPEFSYGGLRWSPDETWIVAVRNNLRAPNPKPEVWLVRVPESGSVEMDAPAEQYLLATDATIPAWVP